MARSGSVLWFGVANDFCLCLAEPDVTLQLSGIYYFNWIQNYRRSCCRVCAEKDIGKTEEKKIGSVPG